MWFVVWWPHHAISRVALANYNATYNNARRAYEKFKNCPTDKLTTILMNKRMNTINPNGGLLTKINEIFPVISDSGPLLARISYTWIGPKVDFEWCAQQAALAPRLCQTTEQNHSWAVAAVFDRNPPNCSQKTLPFRNQSLNFLQHWCGSVQFLFRDTRVRALTQRLENDTISMSIVYDRPISMGNAITKPSQLAAIKRKINESFLICQFCRWCFYDLHARKGNFSRRYW